MAIFSLYTAYTNRKRIGRIIRWLVVLLIVIFVFLYIVIATVFAVIQGNGAVSDGNPDNLGSFTEFESFTYKTIYSSIWHDYKHPYIFPTLGSLTQGVMLDASAKVGLRHVAWDIADRVSRQTEVRAFSEGTVSAVKDNILYNTNRRWKFCDDPSGICWYVVQEKANVQYACGYEVWIQHPDSLRSQYCHLASPPSVSSGDTVTAGDIIGIQGSTGWATGKHLHFALWRDGQPIDPSYAFTQTSLAGWGQ